MFQKKHTPYIHVHPPQHTHTYHAHTHDPIYSTMLTCTHCGRTGHLAKFCYDRINAINFASKNVWVRKGTNPHGPKKIWVPRFTRIVFDVDVRSHKM